jgi:hypothetical protein
MCNGVMKLWSGGHVHYLPAHPATAGFSSSYMTVQEPELSKVNFKKQALQKSYSLSF